MERAGETTATIDERKPINFKIGKRLFGAIRKGQVWKKRDTGRTMEVIGNGRRDTFKVLFDGDSRGMRCHAIKAFDIYRFYILKEK